MPEPLTWRTADHHAAVSRKRLNDDIRDRSGYPNPSRQLARDIGEEVFLKRERRDTKSQMAMRDAIAARMEKTCSTAYSSEPNHGTMLSPAAVIAPVLVVEATFSPLASQRRPS